MTIHIHSFIHLIECLPAVLQYRLDTIDSYSYARIA